VSARAQTKIEEKNESFFTKLYMIIYSTSLYFLIGVTRHFEKIWAGTIYV